MKDYRVSVKVRNNRILNAINEAGGEPGWKWCAENGLTYSLVNDLINMTAGPLLADGSLRAVAEKLCDVLGKLPEELWSNEQIYPLEKNFSEMEMDYAQVVALLPRDEQSYLMDTSALEQEQARALIAKAIETLTEREQEIIRMRFEDDMTLEQIGESLRVSPERARQIEGRALRKLRNPKRSIHLVDCSDGRYLEGLRQHD